MTPKPIDSIAMNIKKHLAPNDLELLIQELISCAIICESSASALEASNLEGFNAVIEINKDCSVTCRRAVFLFENEKSSGPLFLQPCEEVCKICVEENSKHSNESCNKAAKACHDFLEFLQSIK